MCVPRPHGGARPVDSSVGGSNPPQWKRRASRRSGLTGRRSSDGKPAGGGRAAGEPRFAADAPPRLLPSLQQTRVVRCVRSAARAPAWWRRQRGTSLCPRAGGVAWGRGGGGQLAALPAAGAIWARPRTRRPCGCHSCLFFQFWWKGRWGGGAARLPEIAMMVHRRAGAGTGEGTRGGRRPGDQWRVAETDSMACLPRMADQSPIAGRADTATGGKSRTPPAACAGDTNRIGRVRGVGQGRVAPATTWRATHPTRAIPPPSHGRPCGAHK